ncbi:MAG: FKBP-type peptidyl-prolyl cis-trans isomerase [Chitinophagaceae bacterium]|nr:FKBP-type peptidyl-prolyl cis-trans isomerase [Chitinophagaceae bacterium]
MKLTGILSLSIAILLSCNSVDFKKTKGGMPYKLFPSNNGKKIESGNYIKANILQKIKDSVVFSTYESMPVYFPVTATNATYDVSEVLPTLKQGDSVYAVQVMDTFIKRNPAGVPPQYKKGDKIVTTIKVLDVFKTPAEAQQDEMKERTAFSKKEETTVKNYLGKKNITTQRTENGAFVEILDPGAGPQADSGKYVTVMYKGSTFTGKVFDTNMDPAFGHSEPLGFVIGTVGAGGAIKGLDEGIRLLKKGGKARIYIPSMLAYGPQSPMPDIKPFESLIFEIQIVDVQDKAPSQPQMPQQNMDTTRQQR